MPIIDNHATPMPEPEDGRSARRFVTKAAGAVNVTVGELVMQDGAAEDFHLTISRQRRNPGRIVAPPPLRHHPVQSPVRKSFLQQDCMTY